MTREEIIVGGGTGTAFSARSRKTFTKSICPHVLELPSNSDMIYIHPTQAILPLPIRSAVVISQYRFLAGRETHRR